MKYLVENEIIPVVKEYERRTLSTNNFTYGQGESLISAD
jgi:hypothetical protein